MRMVAGLETPDEGQIWIGDQLVASPRKGLNVPPEKRNVGMVFQSYAIWPHRTVFENIAYPLSIRRHSRSNINAQVAKSCRCSGWTGWRNGIPAS